jgi:hypothetical protein
MTGEKKGSGQHQASATTRTEKHIKRRLLTLVDLSNRLKRPLKSNSRTPNSPAPAISTPPKAALASEKSKDNMHRRKNPLNEMLHRRPNKESTGSSPPRIEERNHNDHEDERHGSIGSPKTSVDVRAGDRIAELERALALASQRQSELTEELEKSRQHSQEYEEHRRQFSGNGPRPKTPEPSSTHSGPSPRRSPHRPREEVVKQNHELKNMVAELQEQLVAQDSAYRSRLDHLYGSRDPEWNELAARLRHSEKESQDRLQQLLDLKHSISSLTRLDDQVTDSEIAERFDHVYHRLREWVVSNFRRAKSDFSRLDQKTAQSLHLISPAYAETNSTDRLAFYQAIVSSSLMQIFNEPICIGIPETGPLATIRQLGAYIRYTGSEYREWRRTTIKALEKSEARHALQEEKQKLLHRLADDIQKQLYSVTSVELSPTAQASLIGILNMAADLHRVLSLQKAQYEIEFFRAQTNTEAYFEESTMEPVNDFDAMEEDGDALISRKVRFCVYPCLVKYGDEYGERMDMKNILLKARVCCGVG